MPYGNTSGRKKKKAPPRSKKRGKKSLDQKPSKGPRKGRSMRKNGSQSGTGY